MKMTERERFQTRVREMQGNGLIGLHFTTGKITASSVKSFYVEANSLLDAIEREEQVKHQCDAVLRAYEKGLTTPVTNI